MTPAIYQALLRRELFFDKPVIREFFDRCLREKTEREFKKLSDGEFLFDVNDAVFKTMIEKSDTVFSNAILKELVITYFRYLALFSSEVPLSEVELGHLMSSERTIANALGMEKRYKPFLERMGKMGQVILAYRDLPSEAIWKWIY